MGLSQFGTSAPDYFPVRLQWMQNAGTQVLVNVGKRPVCLSYRALTPKRFEMKSGAALGMMQGQKRNGLTRRNDKLLDGVRLGLIGVQFEEYSRVEIMIHRSPLASSSN